MAQADVLHQEMNACRYQDVQIKQKLIMECGL